MYLPSPLLPKNHSTHTFSAHTQCGSSVVHHVLLLHLHGKTNKVCVHNKVAVFLHDEALKFRKTSHTDWVSAATPDFSDYTFKSFPRVLLAKHSSVTNTPHHWLCLVLLPFHTIMSDRQAEALGSHDSQLAFCSSSFLR